MFRYSILVVSCCLSIAGSAWGTIYGPGDLPIDGGSLLIGTGDTLVIPSGSDAYLDGTIRVYCDTVNDPLHIFISGHLELSDQAYFDMFRGTIDMKIDGALSGDRFDLYNSYSHTTIDATSANIDLQTLKMIIMYGGNLSWESNGFTAGELNLFQIVGPTEFTDTGLATIGMASLKSQDDGTHDNRLQVNFNDVAAGASMTLISNGTAGHLGTLFSGEATLDLLSLDSNYGGSIQLDTDPFAQVHADLFMVDCAHTSHGVASISGLENRGILTADAVDFGTSTTVERIGGTLTATYPDGGTFTLVNHGITNIPEPGVMTFGLIGVIAFTRRRGCR